MMLLAKIANQLTKDITAAPIPEGHSGVDVSHTFEIGKVQVELSLYKEQVDPALCYKQYRRFKMLYVVSAEVWYYPYLWEYDRFHCHTALLRDATRIDHHLARCLKFVLQQAGQAQITRLLQFNNAAIGLLPKE